MLCADLLGLVLHPQYATWSVVLLTLLMSLLHAWVWVVPSISPQTWQYVLVMGVYHACGQLGLVLIALHYCRYRTTLLLRAFPTAMALAFPLAAYFANSCVVALCDFFVWGLPASFAWVLCGGTFRAIKWIWGLHFASLVLCIVAEFVVSGPCSLQSGHAPDTAVPRTVMVELMATLLPQALSAVCFWGCCAQYELQVCQGGEGGKPAARGVRGIFCQGRQILGLEQMDVDTFGSPPSYPSPPIEHPWGGPESVG